MKDPLQTYLSRSKEQQLSAEVKNLAERLKHAEERHAFLDRISKPLAPIKIRRRETKSKLREGTAIILGSDWHLEENVYKVSVSGRNEYNPAIAEKRLQRFFDGAQWLIEANREIYTLRDAVVWLGGDLITGYIHEELEEDNDLSPTEAVLFAKRLITRGIRQILADRKLERLVIPCSYGNHGRTTQKRRIKTGAKNSYEWLLYNVLQQQFADEKRVQFDVTPTAHQYVDVYDFCLHFTHGDELKFSGGVGGLSVPLNKRVPLWNNVHRADYHHIGHFHQLRDFGHTVVNGSLIGYNEYALSIGADYEPPQQAFYILDARRGKCLSTPIWVDEEPRK